MRIDDKIGDDKWEKKNGSNYKFGKKTKENIFKDLYYRRLTTGNCL